MNPVKSNLQFIITPPHSDNVICSISGCTSVIREIELDIVEFSKTHNNLKIEKTAKGFMLSSKAYMAIQHVIYEKIK